MKKITVASLIVLTTLVTGVAYTNLNQTSATTTEDFPIVQQVQHQQEVLNNHEDRITNTEADVSDLQANTNTAPSQTKVIVREVVTVSPEEPLYIEPTPQLDPIIVTSYRQILLANSEDVDCEYTYSDGTTYQWHWQTVEYNQGTKITRGNGVCDNTAIGKSKL